MILLLGLLGGLAVGLALGYWWGAQRAASRDQDREALFAFAAHELASPLTGVQLTVRNFLSGVFGDVPADHRKWLEILQDQVTWLGGLAGDLGDLSHLELGGRLKVQVSEFPAGRPLARAAEGFKRQAERWGVVLKPEIPEGLPSAKGDEHRVERLMSNLLTHALKFSAPKKEVLAVVSAPAEGGVVYEVSFTPVDQKGPSPDKLLERFAISRGGKTLRISGVGLAFGAEAAARFGGRLEGLRGPDGLDRFRLTLASAVSPLPARDGGPAGGGVSRK